MVLDSQVTPSIESKSKFQSKGANDMKKLLEELETEPSFGKSVEDMLEELNAGGVTINIYSPHFFSSSCVNEWHVDIKKKTETLEVLIHGEQQTLRESTREAYNSWHDTLKSGVREKLNYTPQIEHKAEVEVKTLSGIEALHKIAFDDDIPF